MSNANYLHQQLFAFSNHTLGKRARPHRLVLLTGKTEYFRNTLMRIVGGGATEANQRERMTGNVDFIKDPRASVS